MQIVPNQKLNRCLISNLCWAKNLMLGYIFSCFIVFFQTIGCRSTLFWKLNIRNFEAQQRMCALCSFPLPQTQTRMIIEMKTIVALYRNRQASEQELRAMEINEKWVKNEVNALLWHTHAHTSNSFNSIMKLNEVINKSRNLWLGQIKDSAQIYSSAIKIIRNGELGIRHRFIHIPYNWFLCFWTSKWHRINTQ